MTFPETFEDFKNSFSYGARSDLNFKFLKHLPPEEAADFFQELLWLLGDFLDDGQSDRLAAALTRWQSRVYSRPTSWEYDHGPFAPLERPLEETTLALLTSSGHYVAGDDPRPFGIEGMSQAQAEARIGDFIKGEPTLSNIPVETPTENLRVRHGGYDVRAAQSDPNTVFPLGPLRALAAQGRIRLHSKAYSFVGATAQTPLLNKHAPRWASELKEAGVQAVLLVPV